MCVRVQIPIKLLDAEKSKGALSDLKSITINLYRKIGSLQMDHPCFLLRAYAQDTWHNKVRRALEVATYLSLLDTFVADTRVPFRAMCSVYSDSRSLFSRRLLLVATVITTLHETFA